VGKSRRRSGPKVLAAPTLDLLLRRPSYQGRDCPRERGYFNTLFTDDAATLIHATARGYPRAVNNLAIAALVAAYAAGQSLIDEKAARAAVAEVTDG
jgi:hypothetical protein